VNPSFSGHKERDFECEKEEGGRKKEGKSFLMLLPLVPAGFDPDTRTFVLRQSLSLAAVAICSCVLACELIPARAPCCLSFSQSLQFLASAYLIGP
jgi:hypothetical protein